MSTEDLNLDQDMAEISRLIEELNSSSEISLEEKVERLRLLLSVITEIKAN